MWFKKVNNTMRIAKINLTVYKHRDEVAYNTYFVYQLSLCKMVKIILFT